jgi:hypothetical protein
VPTHDRLGTDRLTSGMRRRDAIPRTFPGRRSPGARSYLYRGTRCPGSGTGRAGLRRADGRWPPRSAERTHRSLAPTSRDRRIARGSGRRGPHLPGGVGSRERLGGSPLGASDARAIRRLPPWPRGRRANPPFTCAILEDGRSGVVAEGPGPPRRSVSGRSRMRAGHRGVPGRLGTGRRPPGPVGDAGRRRGWRKWALSRNEAKSAAPGCHRKIGRTRRPILRMIYAGAVVRGMIPMRRIIPTAGDPAGADHIRPRRRRSSSMVVMK